MFAVDHVLISDELLDAPFACNLAACAGGCCVQGDSGAPLEADEREALEAAVPHVRKYLVPEALAVIDDAGAWEETSDGGYATRCLADGPCVLVTYDGPVAKCALQKAHAKGEIDFPKPISCHLYPLRVTDYGDLEALNYEQIDLCGAARKNGRRLGLQLADFLREPLVRRYGEAWYEQFVTTLRARRDALGVETV